MQKHKHVQSMLLDFRLCYWWLYSKLYIGIEMVCS